MSVTSSLERELKLSAPSGFRLPPLDDLGAGLRAEPQEAERATAVYYDTQDLRLTRWDVGLRYRSSDGWTLKLGAQDAGPTLARRELHIAGGPGPPPPAARDLVLAITRGLPLESVARLHTLRRCVRVLDERDRLLAEVTNDAVEVLEGERVAKSFQEVEVELAGGCPPEVVEAILARLRGAGVGAPHRLPKHLRALGFDSRIAPELALAEPDARACAADVVRHCIARSVEALVRHDAGVRADEDPEDLHQMRVATRRLRSALGTFGALVDPDWARELRVDLRELGEGLGRVRDADVRAARLEGTSAELPPLDRGPAKELPDLLARERAVELERLVALLRSDRYLALVGRLIDAAQQPRLGPEAEGPATRVLAPLVRRRWRRLRRAVGRLPPVPSEADWHRVRIRAKHLRYASEALEPVHGKPARRLVRRARAVQHVLGEHRDAKEMQVWLRDAAGRSSAAAAFAAGRLAAREAELAREALELWPQAWRRASRRGRRRWLHRAALRSAAT